MAYTTIDDPEAYFQAKTFAGNNSTQSITLDGDTDLQPDFVWIKSRSDAGEHTLYDSVRGATKRFDSADDGAEDTVTNGVTAFNSDGFSLGAGGNENSASSIISWCWKESSTAGFDIVGYTGDGVIGTTVAHSLSAKPEFIIIKARAGTNATNNWYCWHVGLAANKNMSLNTTAAEFTDPGSGIINTTQNTSTFGFYSSDSSGIVNVNEDGTTFIAYLFAPKQGFSKFGSYTGNANADGPFIWTGFSPSFVMAKMTSGTGNWNTFDNKRTDSGGGNVIDKRIKNNSNAAEIDGTANQVDFLSNGFKWRGTDDDTNISSGSFVYMAFAEAPFVNSNGVPANAS